MSPAHAFTVLKALGPIDLRNVRRDALLRWIVLFPAILSLALRWGTPWVATALRRDYHVDLVPYYPLIAGFMVMIAPMLAGVVIGFLLLDHRDDNTLTALQVTPLSLSGYLVYRLGTLTAAAVAVTVVCIPLTGLVEIDLASLILVALTAAPLGPIFALFVAGFAANKVQGFALMKVAGVVNWPPIIAWFMPVPWQWIMGVAPTYWPAKVFWLVVANEPRYVLYSIVGIAYDAVLLVVLVRRFETVSQR